MRYWETEEFQEYRDYCRGRRPRSAEDLSEENKKIIQEDIQEILKRHSCSSIWLMGSYSMGYEVNPHTPERIRTIAKTLFQKESSDRDYFIGENISEVMGDVQLLPFKSPHAILVWRRSDGTAPEST